MYGLRRISNSCFCLSLEALLLDPSRQLERLCRGALLLDLFHQLLNRYQRSTGNLLQHHPCFD